MTRTVIFKALLLSATLFGAVFNSDAIAKHQPLI